MDYKNLYSQRDAERNRRMEDIIASQGFSISEVLRHWPAYIQRRWLTRFLAHYELFRMVQELPGSIIELGVYRGASFFTWANLLETFFPGDRSRKVYGFDSFAGLNSEQFDDELDGERDGRDGKEDWAYQTPAGPVRELVKLHTEDNILPGIERCVLIEGDVFETVPAFIRDNPGLRVSLIHFDMDLYKPTRFCLEQFYPLILRGGVLCFDEFGLVPWGGETKAVEEFFGDRPPRMRKMPFSPTPGGYCIKDEA